MRIMQAKIALRWHTIFLLAFVNKRDSLQKHTISMSETQKTGPLIIIHVIWRKCAECNNLNRCHFLAKSLFFGEMSFQLKICRYASFEFGNVFAEITSLQAHKRMNNPKATCRTERARKNEHQQ